MVVVMVAWSAVVKVVKMAVAMVAWWVDLWVVAMVVEKGVVKVALRADQWG